MRPVVARGPIDHRAVRAAPCDAGIEGPEQLSRCASSATTLFRRQAVEHAVHHDGLRLRVARAIRGVVGPGDLQLRDVSLYLLQGRIARSGGPPPYAGQSVCCAASREGKQQCPGGQESGIHANSTIKRKHAMKVVCRIFRGKKQLLSPGATAQSSSRRHPELPACNPA